MHVSENENDLRLAADRPFTDTGKRFPGMALAGAAFLFSFLFLTWIQFSTPSLVDVDGYYHIKMAALIRQQGIPANFIWLPYTVLDESRFTDAHFLFHLLQAPFTYLFDLRLAAKWSAVFFASSVFSFLGWLLFRYRVRFPILWLALIFASSQTFLYRMSMPRAQSLSLLLQLIVFHLIQRKRYGWLLILSAIFVLSYNAFPVLSILVTIGFLTERICEKKWDFRVIVFPMIGILAGLIVNPYFPNNVEFLWNHIVPKIFAESYQTSVGSEWYPYSSLKLLQLCSIGLLSYVLALATTNREEWTIDKPRLFWIFTATVYLILFMKSRRFVEYFPPFAVLALAFSLNTHLQRVSLQSIRSGKGLGAAIIVFLIVTLSFGYSVFGAHHDVKFTHDWRSYQGASNWLREHTPEGSIVFHSDWDDFPMLFFFNTHNRYVVGLDPDLLRLRNEPLFRKYEGITLGKIKSPEKIIQKVFRSNYVFTDNEHEALIKNLKRSKKVVQVYKDDDTRIFKLL